MVNDTVPGQSSPETFSPYLTLDLMHILLPVIDRLLFLNQGINVLALDVILPYKMVKPPTA